MSDKLVFRSSTGVDCYYLGAYGEYLEKRQMFLRSYQFSRKQSFTEKATRSARRVKRFVWTKLRTAKRTAFFYRRKRFFRLLHLHDEPSYCF
ncbi:BnaA09g04180D [Brassica napus]|uniref:BnaA09g04180D protein n=2 Tax=Brassica TaxID=3705 RepID=A0A078FZK7_BRANA|nr:BnaA09g04180D [Brassica napus]